MIALGGSVVYAFATTIQRILCSVFACTGLYYGSHGILLKVRNPRVDLHHYNVLPSGCVAVLITQIGNCESSQTNMVLPVRVELTYPRRKLGELTAVLRQHENGGLLTLRNIFASFWIVPYIGVEN